MRHMPPVSAWLPSLPEEWSLLSFTDSGKVRDSNQAVAGCAAAELGELALRRKLLVRSRKSNIFGFDVYRTSPAEIQVIDTSRTGLPWADELLADLERRCVSEQGRLSLRQWLRQRRNAFFLHRDALAERGVLRHAPGKRSGPFRPFSSERYYPDPGVRDALITELRAAGSV
jgi:Golgi phosphoprotein 3 (GPP34)